MNQQVSRANQEAWTTAYGNSPCVLVVVPADSQLEGEALKWRLQYIYKQETAVLLTSLQTLAITYQDGVRASRERPDSLGDFSGQNSQQPHEKRSQHALLERPCWFDVMADRWRPLSEALGIVASETTS